MTAPEPFRDPQVAPVVEGDRTPSPEPRREHSDQEWRKPAPAEWRKRRREPGELLNRRDAIRAFCSECMGHDSDGLGSVAEAVRQCPAVACWLWPWRNGTQDTTEVTP